FAAGKIGKRQRQIDRDRNGDGDGDADQRIALQHRHGQRRHEHRCPGGEQELRVADARHPQTKLDHYCKQQGPQCGAEECFQHHLPPFVLALAMRFASACSVTGSSMRASAIPTNTSSSDPLQNQSTMSFTARAATSPRAAQSRNPKVRPDTVWVTYPLSSSRRSTVRTVDSFGLRSSFMRMVSAVTSPPSHTSCMTSRSSSPRSAIRSFIAMLPSIVLRVVALWTWRDNRKKRNREFVNSGGRELSAPAAGKFRRRRAEPFRSRA